MATRNPAVTPVEVGSWNPIIYRVLYIPGGAGFFPSTVSCLMCPSEKERCAVPCYMQLMFSKKQQQKREKEKTKDLRHKIINRIIYHCRFNLLKSPRQWFDSERYLDLAGRWCGQKVCVSFGCVSRGRENSSWFLIQNCFQAVAFNERWQKLTGCSMVVSVRDWP